MRSNTFDKTKKHFPCSIKDECFYAWGLAFNQTPLMYYGLQLKGNLKHETMKSALHATLEIHGKLGCVITRQASSWKRWFQYVWKFQEVNSSNVLKFLAAQDHDIELNRGAHYYRDLIFKHSMDISKEPGLRIFLITRDSHQLFHLVGGMYR